jgi:hypothetical protein
VQDNSHLNLTPASALPNRAHPFAAVIAIVISPASIGTIIHQHPLEIPEWGRQQDTSRCRKAGDPLWPRGSCIVRFPFHHTTGRRDASANSVRVAIVAEQSIRLLRPEDFLTVGQSDPHPPGDRIQVFPGDREDVGQEGFDALVQRFGKPCAGHAAKGSLEPEASGKRIHGAATCLSERLCRPWRPAEIGSRSRYPEPSASREVS